MAGRYLTDLADVARATGWPVVEVGAAPSAQGPEWKQRARSSNRAGYSSGRPSHIMVHHTASGPSSDGWPDVNYCTFRADARPVCNLYISRAGTIYVCAAGATNTNGSGTDPCGIASDAMNSHAIGVEAGNNGVGEVWADAQLDCYLALCDELSDAYAIALERLHGHWEYAVGRKIDPAGPPRYQQPPAGPTALSWNMAGFRGDVGSGGAVVPPSPTPPEPTPVPPTPTPTPPQEDWMAQLPTIKKGESGPYVERMQHLLAAAGFMNPANTANYDGVWGNGTEGAKVNFDNAHGLTPSPPTDCGPKSWESLMTGRTW